MTHDWGTNPFATIPTDVKNDMENRKGRALAAEAVPVNMEALVKLMKIIAGDVAVGGWDQQPQLYAIAGDVDDPRLDKMPEIPGHPAIIIQEAWDHGVRLRTDLMLGLAYVNEGWRPKMFDELPDPVQQAGLEAHRNVFPGMSEEDRMAAMKQSYAEMLHHQGIQPSMLPEAARVEVRMVQAVFPNDTFLMLMDERDGETRVPDHVQVASESGDVPLAMYQWLIGTRPGGDETWEREVNA